LEHHLHRGRIESAAEGRLPIKDEDAYRLSPLQHENINMLGRYSFLMPDAVAKGELRPLRNPEDSNS
jgi:hypothetical protein